MDVNPPHRMHNIRSDDDKGAAPLYCISDKTGEKGDARTKETDMRNVIERSL